ncbi:MAG TPA: aminotransferase class V-fold PLP-dependent enzyme [Methylophaga aminisulfidivorans]|nr:aminotransferase class V-fold PLP-dependent enzyme [Methylophaga aminisulfidivorans]
MNSPIDWKNIISQITDDSDLSTIAEYQSLLEEVDLHIQPSWAAHMTPELAPYSQIGMQLAMRHGGNLLSAELYPKLKRIEQETASWISALIGFPYAQFMHGGSYANLQALWQARDSQTHTPSRMTVYASDACHYSINKACQILGLNLLLLPCNSDGTLHLKALKQACQKAPPLAIIATAGTSSSGAIDNIDDIVSISKNIATWVHVDAAWGGSLFLLPELRAQYHQLSEVDSLTFDPHKSLFQPRPCSILFTQRPSAVHAKVDYLHSPPAEKVMGSYGGELFLPLWLNWKTLGTEWFIDKTRQRLAMAEQFATALHTLTKMNVINHGSGIVCFQTRQALPEHLIQKGIISKATLDSSEYYRAVFAGTSSQSDSLLKVLRPFL